LPLLSNGGLLCSYFLDCIRATRSFYNLVFFCHTILRITSLRVALNVIKLVCKNIALARNLNLELHVILSCILVDVAVPLGVKFPSVVPVAVRYCGGREIP